MHWTEILAIVVLVAYLGVMIGIYVYKKIKHKPIVTCACCAHNITGKKLVKAYHKANEKKCCCCEKAE